MLVVGHDMLNLSEEPAVHRIRRSLRARDVVGDIGSVLTIERAERVHRPVSTSEGEATAIDVLVRAHRS